MILLSAKLAPVDNVNVFDPVNTNLSSTDELKLKFALAVERPPAFEKKGTTVADCSAPPEPVTATAILLTPAFDPSGRVAPVGLFRGTVSGTKIQEHKSGLSMISAATSTNFRSYNTVSFVVLDSPSTTSAQTYTVGISGDGATDILAQGDSNISTITLMEIAG